MSVLRKSIELALDGPLTIEFPFKPIEPAENFRGKPVVNRDLCIMCGMCVKVCPAGANSLTKTKDLITLIYDYSHCIYCGMCAEKCPTGACKMSKEFDLSTEDRKNLVMKIEKTQKEVLETIKATKEKKETKGVSLPF